MALAALLVAGAAAATLPLGAPAARADKTDVVVLRNGDRITGEVKGLARGKLDFSTDDAGRLSIEWVKIARITSPHPFNAEDSQGSQYYGRLGDPGRDGAVLFTDVRTDTVAIAQIIGITPLNAAFAQRVTSYLDLGFTVARANLATTFNVDGGMDYRGPEVGAAFSFDSYAQGQETVPTTTRNTLRQSVSWYLPKRWSAVGIAQFEQNDELDLIHRYTLGGAMERELVHTNAMELGVGAGLVGTQEEFSSSPSGTTGFEGLLALDWDAFRFDSPKLDFGLSVAMFPSFTDAGRVRGQSQVRLTYEVFKDFNTGVRFTDTFDSRPPDTGASKNDYVVTLTIGWSYRR